jgi:hypothetical protein
VSLRPSVFIQSGGICARSPAKLRATDSKQEYQGDRETPR